MHRVEYADDGVLRGVETDAHGRHAHMLRHQTHPTAQHRVGDQHAPDLLHHQWWLLAAQHTVPLLQRMLDPPKPQFDLPSWRYSCANSDASNRAGLSIDVMKRRVEPLTCIWIRRPSQCVGRSGRIALNAGHRHADQQVAIAEGLNHLMAQVVLGAHKPVALAPACC